MSDELELFQDAVGLGDVYDAATGDYRVPWPASAWTQLTGLRADPERWQRMILDPSPAEMDANITTAIVDTGVLTHHPFLRGRIAAQQDFTGEGPEDAHGHGTHMALLTAMDVPWMPIISAKVVAREPAPYEEQVVRLARAVDWVIEQKPRILQLAIGRRAPCREQEEPYCAAVKRALDAGIYVVIAGEARCPAECDQRAHVVGVEDEGQGRSGEGAGIATRPYDYMSTEADFIVDLLAGHIAARELAMQPPTPRGRMQPGR